MSCRVSGDSLGCGQLKEWYLNVSDRNGFAWKMFTLLELVRKEIKLDRTRWSHD